MFVIVILMIASLIIAIIFVASFVWAVKTDQFEDTYTPSIRILQDNNFTSNNEQE
ncbi:MAG: cbb3-type cytochrome oxidase assembly protein CcoS [Candidatus Kapabacteria bacterium]|nr:cbb3-type cytochrome oxidase assembly protein CcoS [Candidatus Kapabacteria bacterium]